MKYERKESTHVNTKLVLNVRFMTTEKHSLSHSTCVTLSLRRTYTHTYGQRCLYLSLPFFSHLLHCETLHKIINRNVRRSARQYLEPHSDRLSNQFHHGGGLAGPGRSMDHRDITGGQGVPIYGRGERKRGSQRENDTRRQGVKETVRQYENCVCQVLLARHTGKVSSIHSSHLFVSLLISAHLISSLLFLFDVLHRGKL